MPPSPGTDRTAEADGPLAVLVNLLQTPHRFDLLQALRLLALIRQGPSRPATDGAMQLSPPVHDQNVSMLFQPGSLAAGPNPPVAARDGGATRLTLNVFQLAGPQGALPGPYVEDLIELSANGVDDGKAFLNTLSAPLVDALWRAWVHHQPGLTRETQGRVDPGFLALLALAGFGTDGTRGLLAQSNAGIGDSTAAYFAGMLRIHSRPAQALKQVLSGVLGVPVEIRQTVPRWRPVPQADRPPIAADRRRRPHRRARLGESVVVGDRFLDRQHQIEIVLGPLSRAEFRRLSSTAGSRDGPNLLAIRRIAKLFTGTGVEAILRIVLRRQEVPRLLISAKTPVAERQRVGVDTWLFASTDPGRDMDDHTVSVSSGKAVRRRRRITI